MSNECYGCIYRGPVPNSVHSSCQHPRTDNILGDGLILMTLMDGLVNKHRIPHIFQDLTVDIEPGSIPEGWGVWPWNFDPRWIKKCTGRREE